ncbi:MAG: hypothetical protein V9E99_15905 [Microthrixaceae bacterium]|jgi:hypothetical protein|nr:hypothetical protein [Microthrixaceae bacterium]HMS12878.1 hypothetical protein [Microthrixaceae bacterium]HMT25103.1 hypothetical protein [Microthrixaceae bacterium]HMT61209.1 hypothetical protein [Microthrixaceae bacterium]
MSRTAKLLMICAALAFASTACGDSGKIESKGSTSTTTTTEKDSGDDSGDDSGESTDLIDILMDDQDGPGLDKKDATCVVDALDGEVTDEGMASLKDSEMALSDLSKSDREAVGAAFDDCVDIETFGELIATSMLPEDAISLTDDERTCVTKKILENFDGTGDLMLKMEEMAEDEMGPMIFGALGACVTPDSAKAILISGLTSDGNFDQTQATCIAGQMVDGAGAGPAVEAMMEAGASGDTSQLEQLMTAAATACGIPAG